MKPNRFKFRAWDRIEYKMIYDNFKIYNEIDNGFHSGYENENQEWVTLELMQSTGLQDRVGKEIFEGDVLHLQKDPLTKPPHVWDNIKKEVTYKNGTFEVAGRSVFQASTLFKYKFEIIGNKFSNPELLNAKN